MFRKIRSVWTYFLFFIITLFGVDFVIQQYDYSKYLLSAVKERVTQISNGFYKVTDSKKITVKLLPVPTIIIDDLVISSEDFLTNFFPRVEVKFDILNFENWLARSNFKNFVLYNPNIKLSYDVSASSGFDKKSLFFKGIEDTKVAIHSGELRLIDKETYSSQLDLKNLELLLNIADESSFVLQSKFLFNNDVYDGNLRINDFFNIKNSRYISGRLGSGFFDVILDVIDRKNPNLGALKVEVKGDDAKIKHSISADIQFDNNGGVKLENFNANSNLISGIKGEVSYDLSSKKERLDLKIDKINLVQPKMHAITKNDLSDLFWSFSNNLENILRYASSIDLVIGSIDLSKQFSIKNFTVNALKDSEGLKLNNLSCQLPGDSKMSLKGSFVNDKIPSFKGDISLLTKNMNQMLIGTDDKIPAVFQSGILIMPGVLHLENSQLASKEMAGGGHFAFYNDFRGDVDCYVELLFDYLNLDILGAGDRLDQFLRFLHEADHDSTGKTFYDNFNDFSYFRNHSGFKNIALFASNVYLKKELFSDFNVNVDLDENSGRVDLLDIYHKLANFSGKISLDISDIKPAIDIDMKFSNLSEDFFRAFDIKKSAVNKSQDLNSGKNDEVINFYSIGQVDLKFALEVDNLALGGVTVKNLITSGTGRDQELKIASFDADIFNGKVVANGGVYINSPFYQLQFGVGFQNIDPGMFTEYMIGDGNNSGYLSASGYVSSKGSKKDDFSKNLSGNFKFLGKSILHKGFSIQELIDITSFTTSYEDKIKRIQYYTRYGDSLFDDVSGFLTIEKGIIKIDNMKIRNKYLIGASNILYSLVDNNFNSSTVFSFLLKKGEKPINLIFTTTGVVGDLKNSVDYKELDDYVQNNTQAH